MMNVGKDGLIAGAGKSQSSALSPTHTPHDADSPLMTYREVRFDGKRQFELFAEDIRVRGTVTLQSEVDTTIPLSRMESRIITIRMRNRMFWGGLWITIAGFLGAVVLVAGFQLDPFGLVPGLLGIIGLSGIALCAATIRKTEYARFESDAGLPVLDIARSGSDRASFDEFVNRVSEQVRASRNGT